MENIGVVREVFIPECDDELSSELIGFKVYVYDLDKEINITLKQDEYNVDIYKGDEVIVIKNNDSYDIMLYDGDIDVS